VNARVHNLGDDSCFRIANNEFRRQYDAFLMNVITKDKLDTSDKLCYAYFLLLQDRISEGIDMFSKIDPEEISKNGSLALQYDYMSAYLDFYTGEHNNFKLAREVSEKYLDYPVLHWKALFEEIKDQLKELDGDMDIDREIDQTEDDKKLNLKLSKELEPILFAELKGKRIQVDYENIDSVDIKYYKIDPEILFSRTPFLAQNTEDFAFVKPIQTFTVYLNTSQKTELIDIESSMITSNLIIEVQGQGKQVFLRYFSTSLKLVINENYGELKVTDNEDKPLPLVYIKVFSKNKDGEVKFFRDGYTDINGKYEYAQINSRSIADVERFAIFVASEEHGSMTKETPPPLAIEQNEIDSWQANSMKISKRLKKSAFSKLN
jgi:hypothetical protein